MEKILIIGTDPEFLAGVDAALSFLFPRAQVRAVTNLVDASLAAAPCHSVMLVLDQPSAAQLSEAEQALDRQGLPRWAVVVRGSGDPGSEPAWVKLSEWRFDVLTHVLRLAGQKHELRRQNLQFKGDLLSIATRITHDMRTPLGGIVVATEALNEYLAIKDPGDVARTQQIIESGDDLLKLVRRLTLLAREFAEPAANVRFNMGTVVRDALYRFEVEATRRGASIRQPQAWPEVFSDPSKVETIWGLLIENALRHGGSSPLIALEWKKSELGFSFCVRDEGLGVPLEKRPGLLYPFHLLHDPSAPRGLGLPIAVRLVGMLGGISGYEPGEPRGSRFFFTLPTVQPRDS